MSSQIGKQFRLKRIFNQSSGNTVLLPLDHGLTVGPIEGLKDISTTFKTFAQAEIDGVIIHKGNVAAATKEIKQQTALLIHLSGSTVLAPDANRKALVCTVEEAVQLGADAVSIHVNLGSDNEVDMLADFGFVGKKCYELGMPLLAMVYTRGRHLNIEDNIKNTALAARVASELGADMVKVSFTGTVESFREVVEGCSIPILIAGGERAQSTEEVLSNIKMAMEAGARGVACGRNSFQHHSPSQFCQAVSALVHDNSHINQTLEVMETGRVLCKN